MKKSIFTVAAATMLMSFGLQAQKMEYLFETANMQSKFETSFLQKAGGRTVVYQEKLDNTGKEGNIIKPFESNRQNVLSKSNLLQNIDLQKRTLKPIVSIKKTSKNDVATITFKVIGEPFGEYGIDVGFHLILDADAEMYNKRENGMYNDDVCALYADCEYKIPENANCNFSETDYLLDDEASIEIPGGIYDFMFIYIAPSIPLAELCVLQVNGNLYDGVVDDFEFKNGYEYIFTVEIENIIEYNTENDIALTKIIMPGASMELTDEEEITVVVKNAGIQNIEGVIELSYTINDGDWIVPETLTVNLAPGEENTYTFTTKADFSEGGLYFIKAKVDYDLDLFNLNNKIEDWTRKIVPVELPFIEGFKTGLYNWTIIDADENGETWWYKFFGNGYGGKTGNVTISSIRGNCNDYLISDPIIFPESGTYYFNFYTKNDTPLSHKLKILIGSSPYYEDMEVLMDYPNINNIQWQKNNFSFEIESPNNYYFAFYYYGGMLGYLDLDMISISATNKPDIRYNKIITPLSGCDLTSGGIIGAEVSNIGMAEIQEFTLTYQINEEEVVSQDFSETIGIQESIIVYFDEPADFSSIGEYQVKFTAETPDEDDTLNNYAEIVVKLYVPVSVPFISDFINNNEDQYNFIPTEAFVWTDNTWTFWTNEGYHGWTGMPNVPLLSRCVHLEPDIYSFSFDVDGFGGLGYVNNFYVTYGKSGTDSYEWQPVKEFYNYSNTTEENFMFEISEPGEYVFAFFPVKVEALTISRVIIDVAPEHDFDILKFEFLDLARITPSYQTEGERTINATLKNKGKTNNESGNINLSVNGKDILTEYFAFSEIFETIQIELNPVFESLSPGTLDININFSISDGLEKDLEILKIVSDSTFAWDNIDGEFFDGVGIKNSPGAFGLIYDLTKKDIVTSITVGLWVFNPSANDNIGLAIYSVNDNLELGQMFFEIVHPRTLGNNEKGITFDFPDTELLPGKYYFEIRQLTNNLISVAFDNAPDGFFYSYTNVPNKLGKVSDFGYLHIRPNFGLYGVGISSEKISNSQLTLYPNPVRGELRIENGDLKIEKITICNAAGQVVQTITNVNNTSYKINTERLNSGLYFISVQTKDGVVNSKFVVK